ncbi:MAG: RloB domain-containing protein [Pirellulales bacterium]|nr:RloB domain-containing protein [Pirellulales bacterium]
MCEGRETEPNYFDGLKREDNVRQRWNVQIHTKPSTPPEEVVAEAVRLRHAMGDWDASRDEAWCVLDVEGAQNRDRLLQAVTLARQKDIHICLSNPCFEVWLLAHFVQTAQHFLHANAVIRELNKYWKREFGRDYEKNDNQVFRRLQQWLDQAIKNAATIWEGHPWPPDQQQAEDRNSSTEVFKLVQRLLGPPEDCS